MYLVLVDATSKWLEVCVMNSITSENTIEKLQMIFATHGLPKVIVSDNGPSLTSSEFAQFCRVNGIKHIVSAPYHPATNGLAERAVQSFKLGLEKIQGGSLQSRLSRFLFRYRITPHSVTGVSPAEALMSKRLRCQLDLAHPDFGDRVRNDKSIKNSNQPARVFGIGDRVYARDFRLKKVSWIPGKVVKVSGPLSYHVEVGNGVIRRHVDHLRTWHAQLSSGGSGSDQTDLCDIDFSVSHAGVVDPPPVVSTSNSDSSNISVLAKERKSGAPPRCRSKVFFL